MTEMPQGFLMSLARNMDAMNRFSSMPDSSKEAILERARRVRTKREMDELVDRI
ncbi:MAG: hypothetical protein AAGU74_07820 [Bacillota bacterium]